MFNLNVEFDGIPAVRGAWMQSCNQFLSALPTACSRAADAAAFAARTSHEYKDRTGAATASIRWQLRSVSHRAANAEVTMDAPHANILVEGSAPHVIRPQARNRQVGPLNEGQRRRKRGGGAPVTWLAWGEQGNRNFARVVNHPGTKPGVFFDVAAGVARQRLDMEITRMMNNFARNF